MTTYAVLDVGDLTSVLRLEIYALQGKLLRTEKHSADQGQLLLAWGDLDSGSYLLKVYSSEGQVDLTFVLE